MNNYTKILLLLLIPLINYKSLATQKNYLIQNTPATINIDLIRETNEGAIIGMESKNIYQWLGIPYAKPPINERRWKSPKKPDQRSTQLDATQFGKICPQIENFLTGSRKKNSKKIVGSEDCLTLNIFTPKLSKKELKSKSIPVMVWVHGGFNVIGSANQTFPHQLVKTQQVIIVTIQYRLGFLGWFYHPKIADKNNKIDGSGNFGTLDIIQSLQWIKQNIRAFGGNPNNITLFGESAGGQNVATLLVSPLAKGLFHKAIIQSGVFDTTSLETASNYKHNNGHQYSSSEIINNLLINTNKSKNSKTATEHQQRLSQQEMLTFLQQRSLKELFNAYDNRSLFAIIKSPKVFEDGTVIPKYGILNAIKINKFNKTPIILGTNKDELKFFLINTSTAISRLGPIITINNSDQYERESQYGSDLWKLNHVDIPAKTLVNSGQQHVYTYRFDWDEEATIFFSNYSTLFGASHGFEIPFVFGNTDQGLFSKLIAKNNKNSVYKLSNAMMSYWANFAYTGNPNKGRKNDLPQWTAWSNNNKMIILDSENDQGIHMSSFYLSKKKIINNLKKDPRFKDDIERCHTFKTFLKNSNFTQNDYAQFNNGDCLKYNLESIK